MCKRIDVVSALFVLFASAAVAESQTGSGRETRSSFRTWYMYFGDHPFGSGPWGLHFDGQLRVEDFSEAPQQLLLRPGVNYDVSGNVQLSGGYAFIGNYPEGDARSRPEHRFWQQAILRQSLAASRWVHRYRVEQRLLGSPVGEDEVDFRYANRLRYFLKGTIPIVGDGSRYLGLYNEVFVGFGENVSNPFDQNRSYAALGFSLADQWNIELGYLLQIVQRPGGQVVDFNHTLQIGIFSTAPLD